MKTLSIVLLATLLLAPLAASAAPPQSVKDGALSNNSNFDGAGALETPGADIHDVFDDRSSDGPDGSDIDIDNRGAADNPTGGNGTTRAADVNKL